MASYVSTLKNKNKTNNILPRTKISAIADSNGNYLDENLTAGDINALKGGGVRRFEGNFAQIETSPSAHGYAKGEMLVYNGILYKATSAISIGDNLVVNSNISPYSVSSAISDINNIHLIKSGTVTSGSSLVSGAYSATLQLDKSYSILIPVVMNTQNNTNVVYAPFASSNQIIFFTNYASTRIDYVIYGC